MSLVKRGKGTRVKRGKGKKDQLPTHTTTLSTPSSMNNDDCNFSKTVELSDEEADVNSSTKQNVVNSSTKTTALTTTTIKKRRLSVNPTVVIDKFAAESLDNTAPPFSPLQPVLGFLSDDGDDNSDDNENCATKSPNGNEKGEGEKEKETKNETTKEEDESCPSPSIALSSSTSLPFESTNISPPQKTETKIDPAAPPPAFDLFASVVEDQPPSPRRAAAVSLFSKKNTADQERTTFQPTLVSTMTTPTPYVPPTTTYNPRMAYGSTTAALDLMGVGRGRSMSNGSKNSSSNNSDDWTEMVDPSSGYPYWYNSRTGVSSWEKPSSLRSITTASAAVAAVAAPSTSTRSSTSKPFTSTNPGMNKFLGPRSTTRTPNLNAHLYQKATATPTTPSIPVHSGPGAVTTNSHYNNLRDAPPSMQLTGSSSLSSSATTITATTTITTTTPSSSMRKPQPGQPGYVPVTEAVTRSGPVLGDFSRPAVTVASSSSTQLMSHNNTPRNNTSGSFSSSSSSSPGMFGDMKLRAPTFVNSGTSKRRRRATSTASSSSVEVSSDSMTTNTNTNMNTNINTNTATTNFNAHLYQRATSVSSDDHIPPSPMQQDTTLPPPRSAPLPGPGQPGYIPTTSFSLEGPPAAAPSFHPEATRESSTTTVIQPKVVAHKPMPGQPGYIHPEEEQDVHRSSYTESYMPEPAYQQQPPSHHQQLPYQENLQQVPYQQPLQEPIIEQEPPPIQEPTPEPEPKIPVNLNAHLMSGSSTTTTNMGPLPGQPGHVPPMTKQPLPTSQQRDSSDSFRQVSSTSFSTSFQLTTAPAPTPTPTPTPVDSVMREELESFPGPIFPSTALDSIERAIDNEKKIRSLTCYVQKILDQDITKSLEKNLMLQVLLELCIHRGCLTCAQAIAKSSKHLEDFRLNFARSSTTTTTDDAPPSYMKVTESKREDDSIAAPAAAVTAAELPPPRDTHADAVLLQSLVQANDWIQLAQLLKDGASPSTIIQDASSNNRQTTLLHELSRAPPSTSGGGEEHVEVIRLAVKCSVTEQMLNVMDEDGNTALHLCGRTGNYTMCTFLMESGASREVRNQSGETALETTETVLMDIQKPTQLFLDTMSKLSDENVVDITGTAEVSEPMVIEEEQQPMAPHDEKDEDEDEDEETSNSVDVFKEIKIEEFLTNNSIEAAIEYALHHEQYTHAFMMACTASPTSMDKVARQWIEMNKSSPLSNAYAERMQQQQQQQQQQLLTVEENNETKSSMGGTGSSIEAWVQEVCAVLVMHGEKIEEKQQRTQMLTELGDRAWSERDGGIYLAHTCYMLADLTLERTGEPSQRRMILVGGDHRDVNEPTAYMSNECLHLTEVLDYCRRVHEGEQMEKMHQVATRRHTEHDMSSFHLLHAVRLHECGLSSRAAMYLDAIEIDSLNDVGKNRAHRLREDMAMMSNGNIVESMTDAHCDDGSTLHVRGQQQQQHMAGEYSTMHTTSSAIQNGNESYSYPEQRYPDEQYPDQQEYPNQPQRYTEPAAMSLYSESMPVQSTPQQYPAYEQHYDQHPPHSHAPQQERNGFYNSNSVEGGSSMEAMMGGGSSGSRGGSTDTMMGGGGDGYGGPTLSATMAPGYHHQQQHVPATTAAAAPSPPSTSRPEQNDLAVDNGGGRRGSFLSSAFTVLERVIHGSEDDGTADDDIDGVYSGGGTSSSSSSSSSSAAAESSNLQTSTASTEGSVAKAGSESRRSSWLQGMFRSENDKKKEAKLGKSLEAYFDKSLGKWVFPTEGGEETRGEGVDRGMDNNGPPMAMIGTGNHNAPPSFSGPPSSSMSGGPSFGGGPFMGGAGPQQRYASFGLNVVRSDESEGVAGGHVSNLPPGNNMIPGAF